MSVFAQRRDRVLAQVAQEGLDAFLLTNPVNVTYLTGFSGEATYLLLSPEKLLLVSDGRFVEQLQEECPGLDAYIRPTNQTLPEAAGYVLNRFGSDKVGYESGHLTVAEFGNIKSKSGPIDWKEGSNRIETLRMVKDATELAQIREAIAIAETAFKRFTQTMRPEQTEKQLHDAMEFHVRAAGGRCTAFPTIVAVGDRAALPHAPPSERKLGESPFFLLDWGATGAFYKSDLTRVLWSPKSTSLSSQPLKGKFLQIVKVVRDAQLAALAHMRPGVEAQTVDAAARESIRDAGYGDFFNHGLGHGFGLQIHEAPFMRPTSNVVLQAGMVITLEPGVYLPGELGVRLEDDILITLDGPEILTSLPRTPDELEAGYFV